MFTYVRWERGLFGGVLAYLGGWAAMYSLSPAAVDRAMATSTGITGERVPPLASSVPADVPAWKTLAWIWHGSLFAPMATHYPSTAGTELVNPMTGLADTHAHLFALAPALLFLAGLVVVLGSRTQGPRCELYTGATTVLGFFVCCYVGAAALTTGHWPTDGPDVLRSAYRAGLLYPVAFGGAGGLVARRVKRLGGVTYETPSDDLWRYDNGRGAGERRWE